MESGQYEASTTALQRRGRPMVSGLGLRQFCVITLLFWSYVALSNVLYAHNFGVTVAAVTEKDLFFPWPVRVLQHVLLFPFLLLCYWASLRVGWQALWNRVPAQLLLGVAFCVLPQPLMAVSEKVLFTLGLDDTAPLTMSTGSDFKLQASLWLASATNFFLQYGFGLALISGFALYQRFRDSELQVAALARESNAARLSALRMQLSPHMLFNMLNTIHGQIAWEPRAAQHLVVKFSDLLRRLLSAGEREFVLLSDELQFVNIYLQLQQSRFADRLNFAMPEENHLPTLWVPSLILQPLVENAVVHGLAGHDGPVNISLEVSVNDKQLQLRMTNTQVGAAAARDGSIGLRNVRERLRLHFTDRADLIAGPEMASWVAEITMPMVRDL